MCFSIWKETITFNLYIYNEFKKILKKDCRWIRQLKVKVKTQTEMRRSWQIISTALSEPGSLHSIQFNRNWCQKWIWALHKKVIMPLATTLGEVPKPDTNIMKKIVWLACFILAQRITVVKTNHLSHNYGTSYKYSKYVNKHEQTDRSSVHRHKLSNIDCLPR